MLMCKHKQIFWISCFNSSGLELAEAKSERALKLILAYAYFLTPSCLKWTSHCLISVVKHKLFPVADHLYCLISTSHYFHKPTGPFDHKVLQLQTASQKMCWPPLPTLSAVTTAWR